MITLYDSKLSGNAWKVRLLFARLRIPYRRRTLAVAEGEARTQQFLKLNPLARVPVVEFEDGRALFESNAILLHFAEGSSLLPSQPFERSQVMQWLFFEQYDHVRYLARARFLVTIAKKAQEAAQEVAALRESGMKALDAMERHLSTQPFFVGERCTVADLSLFPYTSMAGEGGYQLEPFPAVRAWLDRMRGEPRFEPLLQGEPHRRHEHG